MTIDRGDVVLLLIGVTIAALLISVARDTRAARRRARIHGPSFRYRGPGLPVDGHVSDAETAELLDIQIALEATHSREEEAVWGVLAAEFDRREGSQR